MSIEELKHHLGQVLTLHQYIRDKRKKVVKHSTSRILLMDVKSIYASDLKEVVIKHTDPGNVFTMESLFMDADGLARNPDIQAKYTIEES